MQVFSGTQIVYAKAHILEMSSVCSRCCLRLSVLMEKETQGKKTVLEKKAMVRCRERCECDHVRS